MSNNPNAQRDGAKTGSPENKPQSGPQDIKITDADKNKSEADKKAQAEKAKAEADKGNAAKNDNTTKVA